jgi:hypothetical protein
VSVSINGGWYVFQSYSSGGEERDRTLPGADAGTWNASARLSCRHSFSKDVFTDCQLQYPDLLGNFDIDSTGLQVVFNTTHSSSIFNNLYQYQCSESAVKLNASVCFWPIPYAGVKAG